MVPDNGAKYEKNHQLYSFEISQQALKSGDKMAIITQIWNRAKFYFTCIQQPMVHDHGMQYEENPSSYHDKMCKDGLMDQTLSYIP